MKNYALSYRARIDFYDAFDYLCNDSLNKALRWEEEVLKTFELLSSFPLSGRSHPSLPAPLRVWTVSNHLIVYNPDEEPVLIVAVLHGSRNLGNLFVERFSGEVE